MEQNLSTFTELELILKYQDTGKEYYFNKLYNNYNKLLMHYAKQTFYTLGNSGYISLFDLFQEYNYYFIVYIKQIKREKIKDFSSFSFKTYLYNYLNSYSIVIKNKYRKGMYDISVYDSLGENKIDDYIQSEYTIENCFNMLGDVIEKFIKKLSELDKKLFLLLTQNCKIKNISIELNIPQSTIYYKRKKIRKMFNEFLKECQYSY